MDEFRMGQYDTRKMYRSTIDKETEIEAFQREQ
jgi:hypothetical protein